MAKLETICWLMLVTVANARSQGSAPSTRSSDYQAFRVPEKQAADELKKMRDAISAAELKILGSRILDYHGIVVFENPKNPEVSQSLRDAFPQMIPVPIREFKGVLSVPTGYFYLQFEDEVPMDVARKRILEAGFRIVSPKLEPRSFIVVERSRLPENREAELAELKKLRGLLYAAPNDIPLPVPAAPRINR